MNLANLEKNLMQSIIIFKHVFKRESHCTKVLKYLQGETHLKDLVQFIPSKYFKMKKYKTIDTLYLIDPKIAKSICKHMMPYIRGSHQIIAETSAGLGLVTSKLLDLNVKQVRMYESCAEFRFALHDFNNMYPKRVEIFTRNFFSLNLLANQDKYDRENRVLQLFKDVPKKAWSEAPCMTIFGCMVNRSFIDYLIKTLALQTEVVSFGRIQVFAIMRPTDFVKLTAGCHNDLHTYIPTSVLFQNLFESELLAKYPRKAFLPWENAHRLKNTPHYSQTIDVDQLYLVKIVPRKTLPLAMEEILPFYFFIKQFFGRGRNFVIPTVEKYFPGCGKQLIVPLKQHAHYFDNLSIHTYFGELNPEQILSVFKEMTQYEGYNSKSFEAMIQSELLKSEIPESNNDLLIEDDMDYLDMEDLEDHID